MVQVVGIVNITTDSFSDGGLYIDTPKAIEHAEELLKAGADILDLGAAASNIHAQQVSAELEVERLNPVVSHLKNRGARISVDSTKTEVQRFALSQKIEFLNDIRGFRDISFYDQLAESEAKLIIMHSISGSEKVESAVRTPEEVWDSIFRFFGSRVADMERAGISRNRFIIDPGMGLFLASNPEPSIFVLKNISTLKKEFGLPVMIGVSRKSFLRTIGKTEQFDINIRTLVAELLAYTQDVDYIRTHDVHALNEALLAISALGDIHSS
jgi:dihydropteroate synthase